MDTSKRKEKELLFESEHVPVSVLSVDIPKRDPEHISSKDREELIRKFLGDACTNGCGHPRRHAAVHPAGLRFPVRESASADQPMVFPDPSSRFQLRTL